MGRAAQKGVFVGETSRANTPPACCWRTEPGAGADYRRARVAAVIYSAVWPAVRVGRVSDIGTMQTGQ